MPRPGSQTPATEKENRLSFLPLGAGLCEAGVFVAGVCDPGRAEGSQPGRLETTGDTMNPEVNRRQFVTSGAAVGSVLAAANGLTAADQPAVRKHPVRLDLLTSREVGE